MYNHDDAINYIEIHNDTGRPILVQVQQSPCTLQMRVVIEEIASPRSGTPIPANQVWLAPVYPGLS